MLKICITWIQNVFRNAQVEKNEAEGKKGWQGKEFCRSILHIQLCANPIKSVKVNPYTISKHGMNK
jgi:hypothetical protein